MTNSFDYIQELASTCSPVGRDCVENISDTEYNCIDQLKPCYGMYADILHDYSNSTVTEDVGWARIMFQEYQEYKAGYLKQFKYPEEFQSQL